MSIESPSTLSSPDTVQIIDHVEAHLDTRVEAVKTAFETKIERINAELAAKDERIDALEAELAAKNERIDNLETQVDTLGIDDLNEIEIRGNEPTLDDLWVLENPLGKLVTQNHRRAKNALITAEDADKPTANDICGMKRLHGRSHRHLVNNLR